MEQAADAEDPNHEVTQGESEDIQETIQNAVNEETNVAYLRGETNNTQEVSNANANS